MPWSSVGKAESIDVMQISDPRIWAYATLFLLGVVYIFRSGRWKISLEARLWVLAGTAIVTGPIVALFAYFTGIGKEQPFKTFALSFLYFPMSLIGLIGFLFTISYLMQLLLWFVPWLDPERPSKELDK